MKILYCIPIIYNSGGMERVLSNKLNWFVNNTNYKISVVTTDNMGRKPFYLFPSAVQFHHLDLNFAAHAKFPLWKKFILHNRLMKIYKKQLTQIIEETNPDIVISMGGKEVSFLSKIKHPCKKIVEMHFSINTRSDFHPHVFPLLNKIRNVQLFRDVQGVDKLVVLTKHDLIEWRKKTKNAIQIPNHTVFIKNAQYDINSKEIIAVGRLEPEKDYKTMIDCWSKVALPHPDWTLKIYGDGSLKEELQNQINELGLVGKISLMGSCQNITDIYSSASIYLMTSLFEGLPMVLLEASSFKLPLVAFDCKFGPSEIIENGKNGFLIEPGNKQSLINSLNLLMENVSLRKEMGENAYMNAMKYAPDYIMPQWVKLFNELTNGTKDNCC